MQRVDDNVIRVTTETLVYQLEYWSDEHEINIIDSETNLVSTVKRELKDHGHEADAGVATDMVRSSMPGTVIKVNVKAGAEVKAGDMLITLISMKNEYVFKA
jgi:acetyl/propionyl-CoA carboxylase alpha subunit